jgi:tape measure domain-containing protein
MREGLRAVSGSAEQAGKDMDFVRTVANRVGADVTQVGQAFLGLQAATKGTAVEGEPTRQVFEAVATAMGKAGKSASETQNALVALAQMASKGTVSMEELRGQLGEALPGALQAAANGLGITTQDLIKLVEEGQIAASELFPALSKGLNDLYGGAPAAQTLSQEITNIKNAFTEMAANIGEAGGLSALKTGAEIAQGALVVLDATIVATGKSIGTMVAAVTNMDFSGLKQAFADIQKAVAAGLVGHGEQVAALDAGPQVEVLAAVLGL